MLPPFSISSFLYYSRYPEESRIFIWSIFHYFLYGEALPYFIFPEDIFIFYNVSSGLYIFYIFAVPDFKTPL